MNEVEIKATFESIKASVDNAAAQFAILAGSPNIPKEGHIPIFIYSGLRKLEEFMHRVSDVTGFQLAHCQEGLDKIVDGAAASGKLSVLPKGGSDGGS